MQKQRDVQIRHEIEKKKDRVWDLLLTLAFVAAPFGFGVRILYSCISWSVAWLAFVRLIWNLEHLSGVSNWQKSVGTLTGTAVLIWATYSPVHTAYIQEKARAVSGDLVAKSDGKDHSNDPPILQMGPTGNLLTWRGPSDAPMMSLYYDKIDLRMVKGRVHLSTTVHDDNKNLIAQISDNHWIVSSSTAVCWDKNYTDDSLEVKDGHGRVVLQVKLMPNIVQIQEEWQWNPGTKSGGIFIQGKYDEKNGIKPIFKYPSELHWGELESGPY